jgi:hypothetical protein
MDTAAMAGSACDRQTGARESAVGIATVTGLDGSGGSNPGKGMILSLLHTLPDRPWSSASLFRAFLTCWRDVTFNFTFHFMENIVQLRIFPLRCDTLYCSRHLSTFRRNDGLNLQDVVLG